MNPMWSVCVLVSMLSVVYSADNKCSAFVDQHVCSKNKPALDNACTAQYQGFREISPKIQSFVNDHIINSYQYILMATNFGNHKANRPGFEALYRKLSDDTWDHAIELIKYNAKRGGQLRNFHDYKDINTFSMLMGSKQAMYEYNSLAKALDITKDLALTAHDIHKDAIRQNTLYHDPEISSYIEKEFVHDHADTIRKLSGYLSDLNGVMSEYQSISGPSLSLYLFDEYLQKEFGVVAPAV